MSPFFLILPLYWLFQMIVLGIVTLFSAITGNYYAAVPRDGGEAGRIVYQQAPVPAQAGTLRLELADGDTFVASSSALRVMRPAESRLLPGRSARAAVVGARLHNADGTEIHCEFGWPAAAGKVAGTCRGEDGRWFDLARTNGDLSSNRPGG